MPAMTFTDITVLEEAVRGVSAAGYECVALVDAGGLVGNWVFNAYGMHRTVAELAEIAAKHGQPIPRLLVVVDDPMSKETADRVRDALVWAGVLPC